MSRILQVATSTYFMNNAYVDNMWIICGYLDIKMWIHINQTSENTQGTYPEYML